MKTFIEIYLEQKELAKKTILTKLREKYPGVKYKILSSECHGPLAETDAGFSFSLKGNDGKTYSGYFHLQHPHNFSDHSKQYCIVRQFDWDKYE